MSGLTLKDQEILETIQRDMNSSISEYLGSKVSNNTYAAIHSSVMQTVKNARNMGLILGEMPLVDINHREELKFLTDKREEIYQKSLLAPSWEEQAELENRMAHLSYKIENLQRQISDDPSSVNVSLKDPNTFEPCDWLKLIGAKF